MPFVPSPPPSLKDPLLQLVRAKEHLENLHTEVGMFHTSMPTEISIQEHPTEPVKIIYVKTPMPPERIGLVAGDVFFSLRASLDHLMYQLALLTTETPNGRSEFPCAWSYDAREGKRGTEARLKETLKELPEAAADEVKALQPYHRGGSYKDDPLWQIDKLCNLAKHKVIPLFGTVADWRMNIDQSGIASVSMPRLGEIVYVLTPEGSAKAKLAPRATAGVLFGSRSDGIEIGHTEIRGLYEYVRVTVFPRFARFFKPGQAP